MPEAVEAVRAVLALPDEELDYARAKLAFDRIVDPSIDEAATLAELELMAETARAMAGPSADDDAKIAALRRLIYESGPWNGHRPFSYDQEDPFGQGGCHSRLSSYLATRRGNCMTMPVLFLILAEKLGVSMALSQAPDHFLLQYRHKSGRIFNLEATSGALPARTEYYRENFLMSERSIESGLYLKWLPKREAIAALAAEVTVHLREQRRFAELIKLAELILQHAPTDIHAMLSLGSACGHLLKSEFEDKYPTPILIPAHLRSRHMMLAERNHSLFHAAEALGWQEEERTK